MVSTGIPEAIIQEAGKKIGNTPVHKISNRLFNNPHVQIYAKKEWLQTGGSVKARAAFNIIRTALKTGELNENKVLLDATSGNTGIAYAAVAKGTGY